MEQKVRILSLEIKNMKNVIYGNICFPETDEACIVGIYGQNGSGKTTAIQALDIFRIAASGDPLPKTESDLITHGYEECIITVNFALTLNNKKIKVRYQCCISAENGSSFSSEKLSAVKNKKMQILFRYSNKDSINYPFGPKNKLSLVTEGDRKKKTDCVVARAVTAERRTSLLFSKEFMRLIESPEKDDFELIVSTLHHYAKNYLFTNTDSNHISMTPFLPLSIRHRSNEGVTVGKIPLAQTGEVVAEERLFKITKNVVESISGVLSSLVPGLSIKIVEHEHVSMPNRMNGIKYEVFSERNGDLIPIKYESDGIRKLLSVLSLIIAAYNNDSVCVAIDEFDSGVFELLLGDMLRVFSESGKGQMVFTLHNLHPLEVLDKRSIVFTTVNPENRYILMRNVRPTNNLRDYYFRTLALGGQDEELASKTDSVTIKQAFKKAEIQNVEA